MIQAALRLGVTLSPGGRGVAYLGTIYEVHIYILLYFKQGGQRESGLRYTGDALTVEASKGTRPLPRPVNLLFCGGFSGSTT